MVSFFSTTDHNFIHSRPSWNWHHFHLSSLDKIDTHRTTRWPLTMVTIRPIQCRWIPMNMDIQWFAVLGEFARWPDKSYYTVYLIQKKSVSRRERPSISIAPCPIVQSATALNGWMPFSSKSDVTFQSMECTWRSIMICTGLNVRGLHPMHWVNTWRNLNFSKTMLCLKKV